VQRFEWVRQVAQDVLVLVHARPGARTTAIAGLHDGRLKVALAAPPVDGKANERLLDFFAASLRVPRRRVHLQTGAASREKTVRIEGCDANTAARMLLAGIVKGRSRN